MLIRRDMFRYYLYMGRGAGSSYILEDIERAGFGSTVQEMGSLNEKILEAQRLEEIKRAKKEAMEAAASEAAKAAIVKPDPQKIIPDVLAINFKKKNTDSYLLALKPHPALATFLSNGFYQLDERTFTLDLANISDSQILSNILYSLPGNLIYDPNEMAEVERRGRHIESNYKSIGVIHSLLTQIGAGRNKPWVFNDLAARAFPPNLPASNAHSALRIDINGSLMILTLVSFGPRNALRIFPRAIDLNLFPSQEIKPSVNVTRLQAIKIFEEAKAAGWRTTGSKPK
jgi:hypothetical protein